jgi:hypothetical protein
VHHAEQFGPRHFERGAIGNGGGRRLRRPSIRLLPGAKNSVAGLPRRICWLRSADFVSPRVPNSLHHRPERTIANKLSSFAYDRTIARRPDSIAGPNAHFPFLHDGTQFGRLPNLFHALLQRRLRILVRRMETLWKNYKSSRPAGNRRVRDNQEIPGAVSREATEVRAAFPFEKSL